MGAAAIAVHITGTEVTRHHAVRVGSFSPFKRRTAQCHNNGGNIRAQKLLLQESAVIRWTRAALRRRCLPRKWGGGGRCLSWKFLEATTLPSGCSEGRSMIQERHNSMVTITARQEEELQGSSSTITTFTVASRNNTTISTTFRIISTRSLVATLVVTVQCLSDPGNREEAISTPVLLTFNDLCSSDEKSGLLARNHLS